jgi:hypothetical protein
MTRQTHSCGNEYVSNNRVTSVAMQQRCKHAFPTRERLCFLRGPCKKEFSREELNRVSRRQLARIWAWEQRNWTKSSLRNWQLQNNGKKGIGLWKEDFICDLKLRWGCNKSVVRIRLVTTQNPSACGTLNCKVCRIVIALCCLQFRTVWMYKVQ